MKKVYGVGVNDLAFENKSSVSDALYVKWVSMLARCYSDKIQQEQPSYIGCKVCNEWHLFSKFKEWAELTYFEGTNLDKDLLGLNSKIYSPDTCIFIAPQINQFIRENSGPKNDLPLGVRLKDYYKKRPEIKPRYESRLYFNGSIALGHFDEPLLAHKAWQKKKIEIAKELSMEVKNPQVSNKLYNLSLVIENDYNSNIETFEWLSRI